MDGFIVVKSKKRRAREVIDIGSGYKEKDAAVLRRTLRVGRPGRFAIKEID